MSDINDMQIKENAVINDRPGRKNFIKNLVKNVTAALKEVFKDYPVTMVMISPEVRIVWMEPS